MRRGVDPLGGGVAIDAASLGEGGDEGGVSRVDDGADLLALGVAHLVAHEHLARALVGAAREDLGLDPGVREGAAEVAALDRVAERARGRLRPDDDEARGRGEEQSAVVGAVRADRR